MKLEKKKWSENKSSKSKSVLPIFFQAIQVALMVEIQSEMFKVLVQIISKFLLQTITEQEIIQRSKELTVNVSRKIKHFFISLFKETVYEIQKT